MKKNLQGRIVFFSGLLLTLFVLSQTRLYAQKEEEKYKFHPVFIYNFIKYSQWPPAASTGPVIIGILGDSPISAELAKMAQGRMIGDRKILVRTFKGARSLPFCHVLFVPETYRENFSFLLSATSEYHTLIITEKEGMAKAGAGINFIFQEDKLKYQINEGALESKGIKIANEISKLSLPL